MKATPLTISRRLDASLSRLLLCALVWLALTSSPSIAVALTDDFENGTLGGWLSATNGGIRTEGVELHNGSQMAFVTQVGSANSFSSSTTESSLSRDFSYSQDSRLQFDMHATANTGRNQFTTVHSGSGATITFLNVFNGILGSAGLYNYTDPSVLPATAAAIDSNQHSYDVSMADFATLAGLDPNSSAIAKVTLSFEAWAQFTGGGNIYPNAVAFSSVWFDNVTAVVPEPETYMQILAGLCMVGVAFRLRRSRRLR